jgi:alkylated DNA repair dioxygenase AlkB
MDLFSNERRGNLLPYDGEVIYNGPIFSQQEAASHLDDLLNNISWQHDEAIIFGKHIVTKRMAAWYGERAFAYTYSNITKEALIWTPDLIALKKRVEQVSGAIFNSCLLNLYHNGDEGMAWHSDDEKSLGKDTTIASLSFGAPRKFAFKHKGTKLTTDLFLENGSLLLMKGTTQTHWLHSLSKSKKVITPRVNLTFRTYRSIV